MGLLSEKTFSGIELQWLLIAGTVSLDYLLFLAIPTRSQITGNADFSQMVTVYSLPLLSTMKQLLTSGLTSLLCTYSLAQRHILLNVLLTWYHQLDGINPSSGRSQSLPQIYD